MRKLDYRAPRYPVDLLVRVTFEDSIWIGHCTEISAEGMRIHTRDPLCINSFGVMQVTHDSLTLDIPIQVVHCGPDCQGLRFMFSSRENRAEVADFVTQLVGQRAQTVSNRSY